ncbi:MAG: hypothetical protein HY728_03505 [Candidatus Rokubacteria bacterium]|nr:hypothetical protein [Candidatus Rokubacteria bacterium]
MRFLTSVFWLAAVALLLLPALRRVLRRPAGRPPLAIRDELVKDPVCQTYVVRSRAVSRTDRGEAVYFCSARCAERYG